MRNFLLIADATFFRHRKKLKLICFISSIATKISVATPPVRRRINLKQLCGFQQGRIIELIKMYTHYCEFGLSEPQGKDNYDEKMLAIFTRDLCLLRPEVQVAHDSIVHLFGQSD